MNTQKKRTSYEDILKDREGIVKGLSMSELEVYRQNIIKWKENTELLLKEENIIEGRKQYLIGLRNRVINPLLSVIKERKATFNRVVNNNGTSGFLKRFYESAASQLPLYQFQLIIGLALTKEDIEYQDIQDVKEFLIDCKVKFGEGNINENQS